MGEFLDKLVEIFIFFLKAVGFLIKLVIAIGIKFPVIGITLLVILGGLVLLIVIGSIMVYRDDKRAREAGKTYGDMYTQAKMAYQDALAALEENPNNPAYRKAALEKGREYAVYTEDYPTGRLDEIALRNDIEAAVAGRSGPGTGSQADEIRKLLSLKKDGVISQQELDAIKSKLMAQPARVNDVITLLRGLKSLEKEGVLTENEFKMKKWDILSRKLVQD